MFTKLRNVLLTLGSLSVLLSPAFVPAIAHAQDIQGNLCTGSNLTLDSGSGACATNPEATSKLTAIFQQVVNVFSLIVGLVAVVMIIYGGFRYVISGGDSGNVSNAKNTIIFAIVGLIIVALSQVIVHFVLNKLGS